MKVWPVLLFLVASGCVSKKVRMQTDAELPRQASYEDYFDSYFWGFVGKNSVSLEQACVDQRPLAFEKRRSGEDIFLTAITLGIYTPTTVRIWCGN
ncbi:MAG: hypothetical protein AB7F86_07575 [Bdellovibrionales bacterium]